MVAAAIDFNLVNDRFCDGSGVEGLSAFACDGGKSRGIVGVAQHCSYGLRTQVGIQKIRAGVGVA